MAKKINYINTLWEFKGMPTFKGHAETLLEFVFTYQKMIYGCEITIAVGFVFKETMGTKSHKMLNASSQYSIVADEPVDINELFDITKNAAYNLKMYPLAIENKIENFLEIVKEPTMEDVLIDLLDIQQRCSSGLE
jgi:hypothetical protein